MLRVSEKRLAKSCQEKKKKEKEGRKKERKRPAGKAWLEGEKSIAVVHRCDLFELKLMKASKRLGKSVA